VNGLKSILALTASVFLLCMISPALAQDEDEIPGTPQENGNNCIPENLTNSYDALYNPETPENDIRKWYSFGSEYFKVQNYKDALPYLWKVFVNDTGKYAILSIGKITQAYFELQMADSTLIAAYKGLAKFPNYAKLHYYAGYLQDNLGRYKCAIPHYEALVEAEPEQESYLEKLAFLYFKDGNEKAIEIQERLVKLKPDNSEYQNTLAQYMDFFLGPGGALEARKKAYENDPGNLDYALRYGKAAYDAGEYKAALDPLSAALKLDPKNGEAMEYRAMCYEALEQYEKAIVDYKSLVDLQADNAKTMCAIASDYKNRFQFTNGRYWVQRALNIRPGFGLAYITMAEIYEAAVVYCQDQEKRGRKYDDALVYELAYDEYKKAANDPEYKSTATKRMNSLQMVLPTQEELFMNQNRKTLKLECYSWINQ